MRVGDVTRFQPPLPEQIKPVGAPAEKPEPKGPDGQPPRTRETVPKERSPKSRAQNGGPRTWDTTREDSVGMRQLLRIIEQAVKALRGRDVSLRFFVHEPTKEIMVRIIDRETQEVIREIPREEILDMIAKLWELAGLIVDEKR